MSKLPMSEALAAGQSHWEGCHLHDFRHWNCAVEQIADLTAKLAEADQEKADTVLRMSTWAANTLHTCHEGCDRPLCVANREINHLRAEVERLKEDDDAL